jgi:predicted transcriptional regulator
MSRRIMAFSDQSDRELVQLADATHREPAEVIRDALSVYWRHAREQSVGTTILAMRRGQHTAKSIELPRLAGMDPLPPPEGEEPPTNSPRDSGDGVWPVEPLGFAPLT